MTEVVALCQWTDDEVFKPADNIRRRMASLLVVGETYLVNAKEHRPRSRNSHKHFFATLNDIWHTLPEGVAEQYPSAEHFRKKLLIQCGFHKVKDYVADTAAAAASIAAFCETLDEYAVVVVEGPVVRVFTAMSQAEDFMDNGAFQASKTAVLDAANALLQPRSEETENA